MLGSLLNFQRFNHCLGPLCERNEFTSPCVPAQRGSLRGLGRGPGTITGRVFPSKCCPASPDQKSLVPGWVPAPFPGRPHFCLGVVRSLHGAGSPRGPSAVAVLGAPTGCHPALVVGPCGPAFGDFRALSTEIINEPPIIGIEKSFI